MADGHFSPDPWTRLVGISWSTGGGLVYINFYLEAGLKAKTDGSLEGTLKKAPQSISAHIGNWPDPNMDGVDLLSPGNNIKAQGVPDKPGGAQVQNPYTDEMLGYYLAWTPQDPVSRDVITPSRSASGWVVDAANFAGIYQHIFTGQLSRVMPKDQAIAEMFNAFKERRPDAIWEDFGADLAPHYDPALGVQVPTLGPPDPAFFQVAAEAGWIYHEEPGGVVNLYGASDGGAIVINLNKLRKLLPVGRDGKRPNEWTLLITIDDSKDAIWVVSATAEPVGKNADRDFALMNPLSGKAGLPEVVSGTGPNGVVVQAKITFLPPSIKLTRSGDDTEGQIL